MSNPNKLVLKGTDELFKMPMPLNLLIAEYNDFTSIQFKLALEKSGRKVTIIYDGEECFDIYND